MFVFAITECLFLSQIHILNLNPQFDGILELGASESWLGPDGGAL